MQYEENDVQPSYEAKPFTVSAVYCDGSGKLIVRCFAADAQAARDEVLMRTGGAAVIASVFAGHLDEPDVAGRFTHEDATPEKDAVGSGDERNC